MKKNVIITGASSGLGKAAAEALARKGHIVFATMRDTATRNRMACDQLQALANGDGLMLRVLDMDVTQDASVQMAVQEVLQQAGRIDVVINNAGVANIGITEAYTVQQFQYIFDTNFFGVVRVNRAVLPTMRSQRNGLLIHVTSGAGRLPTAFTAPYCATKCALEALADVYRFELCPFGVDSVVVEPGIFNTAIMQNRMIPEDAVRVAEYGPIVNLAERVQDVLTKGMAMSNSQGTDAFEKAIATLIETPPGARPFRTVIGLGSEILTPYNDLAEQLRERVAQNLGLAELLTLR